jgi:hypothetical protein
VEALNEQVVARAAEPIDLRAVIRLAGTAHRASASPRRGVAGVGRGLP